MLGVGVRIEVVTRVGVVIGIRIAVEVRVGLGLELG